MVQRSFFFFLCLLFIFRLSSGFFHFHASSNSYLSKQHSTTTTTLYAKKRTVQNSREKLQFEREKIKKDLTEENGTKIPSSIVVPKSSDEITSTSDSSKSLSRNEDNEEFSIISGDNKSSTDDLIDLPYGGILGYQPGKAVETPVDMLDPLLNPLTISFEDLPGAEGSTERMEALQKLIDDRVQAVNDLIDSREIGNNVKPANPPESLLQSLFKDITMQSKEGPKWSELVFYSFSNVMIGAFFMIYFSVADKFFGNLINWFIDTDFGINFNGIHI
jgi:hypothetical protein